LITQRSTLVLAPNPSPYTLEGTNTWVLCEPGSTAAVVVDPGPLHEGHLAAVIKAVDEQGARVAQILLTHGHPDEGLADGDVVEVGGLELRVVGTPGHTGDSLSFVLPADRALLTGDTVLGRGTTVVAHPDGRLADYLQSLELLHDAAVRHEFETVLPGHGPVLADALGVLEFYIAHRKQRLAQVEAALAAGDSTPSEVVRRVYADVDRSVWPAAELSVQAQLHYLDPVRFS
jgi:glyoxylase-like metal-dependent hydrolase (beta-lactamase superfamily II)